MLNEVSTHFWEEENHDTEDKKEYSNTGDVFHGVVRMERNAVEWLTVFIFIVFYVDTVWVVRSDFMQSQNMQHNQTGNHQG